MAKRKTRRSGGNPFAGRDAEIAELKAQVSELKTSNETQAETIREYQSAEYNNDNHVSRIMAQAKATEARAREIEPRYQREIQFLRDTLHRLTASGFQIEQTYRVAD